MNNNLNFILNRNEELKNYKYIENIEDLENIPGGTYIKYISKNSIFKKKGGFFKNVKDKSIIELYNNYIKKKWYIYADKYYLFYRISQKEKLKILFQEMIDSNFKNLKMN
jgi:hypothetical protein